jgi:hypothetical protein
MSITPQAVQKPLDELDRSRDSRKRAWDNLQELRWVLKDTAGIELPAPARKTIDLVSCPRNTRYFDAIKMGRWQGARRERVSIDT